MISIVIPTCMRAGPLRDALESVRKQSARESIAQVIVSENSICDESRAVCAAFPDLPIDYVHQRPPVPAILHWKAVWGRVRTPLVAVLHDEDWWGPQHLDSSLRALQQNQDCIALFSDYSLASGPKSPAIFSRAAWRVWVSSGCDFRQPVLRMDDVSVLSSCLLGPCLHWSTLVGRTDCLWDAYLRLLPTDDAYENDRVFPVLLSYRGCLAYVTKPDIYVRNHSSQVALEGATWVTSRDKKLATARWLLKTEPQKVAAATERFNRIVATVAPEDRPLLLTALGHVTGWAPGSPHSKVLIHECGFHIPETPKGIRPVQWLLDMLLPPLVTAGIRQLPKAFKRRQA